MAVKKPLVWEEKPNGCWEVTSHKGDKDGYQQIRHKFGQRRANRMVWGVMFGDIPKGHVVRHKCDDSKCVNPEHLEIGTHSDNMQDMVSRNRHSQHGRFTRGNAKIDMEIARQIRQDRKSGMTYCDLASKYNLGTSTIGRIIKNTSWKEEI